MRLGRKAKALNTNKEVVYQPIICENWALMFCQLLYRTGPPTSG
jgi:hypothetical protein